METFVIVATSATKTITATFDNAESAYRAMFWYRWDMTAKPLFPEEPEAEKNAHMTYYWSDRKTPPEKLPGFVSVQAERVITYG